MAPELTPDSSINSTSIIKVIGVGGGGSNAVNHMYRMGIKGVDFIVCNTDQQALDISPVPTKITLGASLTKGRGAGALPEVGRNAAIENIEEIKNILGADTQMVFITAGMGGGTGTGAAPIIAQAAKEMGILTVGIVTLPFSFEGKKRKAQAELGIGEMKKYVDTLLVICNEKLREMYGNLKLGEAFGHADDVLATAAKGIAEIITTTLYVNVDFADITTVMKNSGKAIMGTGVASGEGRATKAVEQAMHSPLLNDNNINGANFVLLNIMCGTEEITMDELGEVTDFIQECAGQTAEIIKGYGIDETLGDKVKVTLIATGFDNNVHKDHDFFDVKNDKIVHSLDGETQTQIVAATPINIESRKEERQATIEFEITNKVENTLPLFADETPEWTNVAQVNVQSTPSAQFSPSAQSAPLAQENEQSRLDKIHAEEQAKKAQERINKLKELSFKIKSPNGITELENEPAYKRRNQDLEPTPHSSESTVSRYTLNDKNEIKPSNSFLHDAVD